ncbi:FAD dependent oxidoreductase [Obba rivulosa]|uniref:FAD dependent oxidoreductase n=1 Tax=Obba rivulosa TaxID=1052685 RepID=A0A8E2AQJ4_9APHY|nr:FAD dependent oxidoreductase [Obba rivulosa]
MSVLPVPLGVAADEQAAFSVLPNGGRASLPVLGPTKSFWINSPGANPLASEGSGGPLTSDADVCIVGSGITGVSAAYHFSQLVGEGTGAQKPLKVVILEARDFCSGATGRNGGHLTPHSCFDFVKLEATFGRDEALRGMAIEEHTARSIIDILQRDGAEKAVDFVPGGRTILLFTEDEVHAAKADYDAALAAGADLSNVTFLTAEETKARYGTSYPAVHTPGNNLWPLKLVTHLFQHAQSSPNLNLTLHTRTPATSIQPISDSARRWQVETPRGSVSCTYVLHASNGYSSALLPHLRGPNGIVPTRGQIIALKADATAARLTTSGYIANEGFEYWFPRPVEDPEKDAPLVILGGGRELVRPHFEFGEVDDSKIDPKVGEVLRKFLPSVFPEMYEEGREPEMEWTGIMGFTKSGDPFVGPVIDSSDPESARAHKGQYISAGYSGHGMPRAFACAEAVAQMILSDMEGKEWTPPEWLPRHYLTQR